MQTTGEGSAIELRTAAINLRRCVYQACDLILQHFDILSPVIEGPILFCIDLS